ncbi:putative Type VI secretion protein, VC_A0114 family [Desulfamplus magnetovallimortis]|uniref:Putative Type VI secretion protein, VC_A0114 family n=1 Tax=Desulfamplus magnetovallimortis TaxID=1246637 RepID=L0R5M1_9BACT|nr:type VI secretion system baseplate subunit TssK [Desulfamplus magnetovallimortis]CCO06825.1 putative Type VI secretion protein, VC_A0114 family [Desulfamplus magnetovallimortis BW-1]SLM32876.1 putative Type VI secretion protein, VC_A0114 family [Desulfamplus magnetovallimortis]
MNNCIKPILWNQGLFLQPHHFQQFDNYLASLVMPHALYHTPFFWGCGTMEIQETALDQRILEITRCELIFQDGTWIQYPGNATTIPRSFKELSFDAEGDKPITAYVGLKKWEQYKKNVTSINDTDTLDKIGTRFVSPLEPEETRDIHEGGDSANVRRMEHCLKIFWDHEIEKFSDYSLLPIMQLKFDGDSVVVSREYVPPLYKISSSDILMQMLKNLREMAISRCRVFESYKFAQGFQSSDFDAHFIPHLLVLNGLNRILPMLNHIVETGDVHPHAAYGLIRAIVGELSTFTDRINALGQLKDGTLMLPEYDHESLFTCFNEAHLLIGELLRGISLGGESIISLIRDNDYFKATIPFEEFHESCLFFIVVHNAPDPDKLINDFHNIIKIGTPSGIENMISRALPGVPVKHRLVPPPGMPKRQDSNYFRIDTKYHLWSDIRRSGGISLYWSNAPDAVSIEIVISRV